MQCPHRHRQFSGNPRRRWVLPGPYRWEIAAAELKDVANVERKMPPEFISADGFHITDACRKYLSPLIEGEDYPPYRNGLPDYVRLKNISVPRKLGEFKI